MAFVPLIGCLTCLVAWTALAEDSDFVTRSGQRCLHWYVVYQALKKELDLCVVFDVISVSAFMWRQIDGCGQWIGKDGAGSGGGFLFTVVEFLWWIATWIRELLQSDIVYLLLSVHVCPSDTDRGCFGFAPFTLSVIPKVFEPCGKKYRLVTV
jgi:hypothetical protein